MKSTKEYAQRIKKLFTALKKGSPKIKKNEFANPVDAMVFAVISQETSEAETASILKKIETHFVDKNDLRVSRSEEIISVIGKDVANVEKIAARLTALLNVVFQKFDRVAMEELGRKGKRNARETLEKFNEMTEYICSYVMLTAVDAHTIPLTDDMFEYLKSYQLVLPDSTPAEAASFLERHISAAHTYTFYALLRRDAESARPIAKTLFSKEDRPSKKKTTKKSVKTTTKKNTKKTVKKKTKKTTKKKPPKK